MCSVIFQFWAEFDKIGMVKSEKFLWQTLECWCEYRSEGSPRMVNANN